MIPAQLCLFSFLWVDLFASLTFPSCLCSPALHFLSHFCRLWFLLLGHISASALFILPWYLAPCPPHSFIRLVPFFPDTHITPTPRSSRRGCSRPFLAYPNCACFWLVHVHIPTSAARLFVDAVDLRPIVLPESLVYVCSIASLLCGLITSREIAVAV